MLHVEVDLNTTCLPWERPAGGYGLSDSWYGERLDTAGCEKPPGIRWLNAMSWLAPACFLHRARLLLNHTWEKWSEMKVSESDVRPSMVTHTLNLCSAFNPSKVHTHSSEHTHTPWTHTQSSGQPFMLRRPGSSWGFGALLKDTSVVVLKEERECCTFTPPTYNSCLARDSNSQPLGYESDSLTIRPRLPLKDKRRSVMKSFLIVPGVWGVFVPALVPLWVWLSGRALLWCRYQGNACVRKLSPAPPAVRPWTSSDCDAVSVSAADRAPIPHLNLHQMDSLKHTPMQRITFEFFIHYRLFYDIILFIYILYVCIYFYFFYILHWLAETQMQRI